MNYKQNYFDFMESRQKLSRSKNEGVYYELHHILPKSLYPEYDKLPGNLVLLTPREHFIAHYLLTKFVLNDIEDWTFKMLCAFFRFCNGNEPNLKFASSRLYEYTRLRWIKSFPTGWHHSEEAKKKISEAHKGIQHSEETKNILREKAIEQFKNQEQKDKHKQAMKDWYENMSEETKAHWKQELSKPRGPYSKERIENARKGTIKSLATIKCIEDGSEWSCVRLADEVNIDRGILKQMILENKEINGKHYYFFKQIWGKK